MMLSTLLQCCIVIVMQIKLTVVVVVVVDKRIRFLCSGNKFEDESHLFNTRL